MTHGRGYRFVLAAALTLWLAAVAHAHSGPPFPILSDQVAGRYRVSIWTDPDATDDGTVAGRFWVVLDTASPGGFIPPGTHAHVAIHALDRPAVTREGDTAPADGLVTRQFVALLMDHEGPYSVRVAIDGPLGHSDVLTRVDATYDLRPPPAELALFLFPFAALAVLWAVVLKKRRRGRMTNPPAVG